MFGAEPNRKRPVPLVGLSLPFRRSGLSSTAASSTKDVALVVSHLVGVDTARHYATSLIDAGRTVRVYCLGPFADSARELMPAGTEVVERSAIAISARLSRVAAQAVYLFADFDPGLNITQRQRFEHRSALGAGMRRTALRLARRVSAKRMNSLSRALLGRGTPVIPESHIWVVSFLTEPLMAMNQDAQVCTILDSWDHPVRKPAGYRSDVVIGWNRDLAEDWVEFQGADRAISAAPVKLRYAAEAWPLETSSAPRLMYAVGTSSHTPEWERAELALVELICEAARSASWDVMLKLKPTGGQEAWQQFPGRFAHVTVTEETDALNPMHYFLDDAYNAKRLEQLGQVQLVLNAVTTFGLDAACAGVPVLQLAGLTGDGLAGLRAAQRNYHLVKYLLSDADVFQVDEGEFAGKLSHWLMAPDRCAVDYSRRLRSWLVSSASFERSIAEATAAALEPARPRP